MKRISVFLVVLISLSGFTAFASPSVYFSPNGNARQELIKLISTSTDPIDVAIYSFTSKELGLALATASKNKRRVRILADYSQSRGKHSVIKWLSAYTEIRILHQNGERGIMHHKFMIIGNKILATGSYNWTNNAEYFNEENLMVFQDQALIQSFKNEFESLWKRARRVEPS